MAVKGTVTSGGEVAGDIEALHKRLAVCLVRLHIRVNPYAAKGAVVVIGAGRSEERSLVDGDQILPVFSDRKFQHIGIGLAGGKKQGILFKKGKALKKVKEKDFVKVLMGEINMMIEERKKN